MEHLPIKRTKRSYDCDALSCARRYGASFQWVVCACCFIVMAGCTNEGYEFSQRYRRSLLAEGGGLESITCGNVVAYYPRGKEGIARRCAEEFARQRDHVADATGIEWVFKGFHLYLKPVDKVSPLDTWAFQESENTFGVILYIEPLDDSYEAVVAKNVWYPLSVIHEIVECSLIQLQLDRRWTSWTGEANKTIGYTRWFREGFSEYAGFLAYKTMMCDRKYAWERFPRGMYQQDFSNHPFSVLRRVGVKLFEWDQFYKGPRIQGDVSPNLPHTGDRDIEYYSAAFGLFLLIESKYGCKSMRMILRDIRELANADGTAIRGIINRTLGVDVVKLVEGFKFPETGLYMNEYWPGYTPNAPPDLRIEQGLYVLLVGPDSPAQRVGIRAGDVVVSLDGERTVTNYDFECALYKHMHQESVKIGLWRKGDGLLTVEMKLGDDFLPRRLGESSSRSGEEAAGDDPNSSSPTSKPAH